MPDRCLFCKTSLTHGVAALYNGDFCSEFCFASHPGNTPRNAKPQWRTRRIANTRKEIDRILTRNHGILRDFRGQANHVSTCSDMGGFQWLRNRGFDFDVHTRMIWHSDGGTEIWCYDEGLRILPNGGTEPL